MKSLYVCVLFVIIFSSDLLDMDDLGFGSVFDGMYEGGKFINISTQAVFDLMKHIKIPEERSSIVEIGSGEIEEYDIPRTETIIPDLSHTHGKWFIFLNGEIKQYSCVLSKCSLCCGGLKF